MGGEALYGRGAGHEGYNVAAEADVFLQRECAEVGKILKSGGEGQSVLKGVPYFPQSGSFHHLKLVEFENVYAPGADEVYSMEHHLKRLAGESHNEVGAGGDACMAGGCYGLQGTFGCMSAPD